MLTLLTPTGARPEAFSACVEQMRAQDYTGPVRWVIVDDGPSPMRTPEIEGWEIDHIRREPYWRPGENTQAVNLLAGLDVIPADARIVNIEDDDGYAPWWLTRCNEWLDSHDLVGESHALYVNKKSGNSQLHKNSEHSSLCSTALKGAAIPLFRHRCEVGDKYIDIRLWRDFTGSKALYKPEPRGVTGIKSWPGRAGIGMGHRL